MWIHHKFLAASLRRNREIMRYKTSSPLFALRLFMTLVSVGAAGIDVLFFLHFRTGMLKTERSSWLRTQRVRQDLGFASFNAE